MSDAALFLISLPDFRGCTSSVFCLVPGNCNCHQDILDHQAFDTAERSVLLAIYPSMHLSVPGEGRLVGFFEKLRGIEGNQDFSENR